MYQDYPYTILVLMLTARYAVDISYIHLCKNRFNFIFFASNSSIHSTLIVSFRECNSIYFDNPLICSATNHVHVHVHANSTYTIFTTSSFETNVGSGIVLTAKTRNIQQIKLCRNLEIRKRFLFFFLRERESERE